MPSDALRVTPAHLRELASTHGDAAIEMTAAAGLVAGMHDRIRISHGVIAAPTAALIATIEEARRAAGHGIARTSHMLRADLDAAAHRYVTTDHDSGAHIDGYAT
jgi:hypothetical protein